MNNTWIYLSLLLLLTSCASNNQPAEVISAQSQFSKPATQPEYYLVKMGDTIDSVAARFGFTRLELLKLNKLSGNFILVPGQRLLVKKRPQNDHVLADEITVKSLDEQNTPSPDGVKLTSSTDESAAVDKEMVQEPATVVEETFVHTTGNYKLPVQGKIVKAYGKQPDGSFNKGVNISAPKGTPVKAIADGVVKHVGSKAQGLGKMILIKHNDGKISAYAHLNSIDVKVNGKVVAGAKIGTVGSTGGGLSQPQLNLQIRGSDKSSIDPKTLIPGLG